MKNHTSRFKTPLGWFEAAQKGGAWAGLRLVPAKKKPAAGYLPPALSAYFKGRSAKVRVAFEGTSFQKRVWKALRGVKWGKTISYAALAKRIGKPRAVRAVARACAQNKIPILVPCHRVIGSGGALTGYALGLRRKAWLLRHEKGGR